MFRCFFLTRQWLPWSLLGTLVILLTTWYQVQLSVSINEWFGSFYNLIQKALATPNAVKEHELMGLLWDFFKISAIFVFVAAVLEFFIRHYVFRWRSALHHYYCHHWNKVSHIEGASQRIQEDTMRFAKMLNDLAIDLVSALMTLIAFQPLLWTLSKQVKVVPFFGEIDHVLTYIAILSAILGTTLLALVGLKLPGLEFNNQKAEAALRKELVLAEDNPAYGQPLTINSLFTHVRQNYITLYQHFLYLDLARWSYMQFATILPYVVMVPTIVSGAITLGVLQQILRAFNKVAESLQYLVKSWSSIVEVISVYQRLSAFERQLKAASLPLSPIATDSI